MKLADRYVGKKATYKVIVQLVLALFCLYIANEITIDVWRSLTGH